MTRTSPRALAVIVVAVVAVTLLPAAAPAAAATCPAPGGVSVPRAAPADGDFVISGRGWGHGVGMSQYGARGAAALGCTAAQILAAYYPGTQLATTDSSKPIRVSVYSAATALRVVADTGSLPWSVCTSSGCRSLDRVQPQGALWYARTAADGTPSLATATKTLWRGNPGQSLRVQATRPGGTTRIVQLPFSGRRYKWGYIHVEPSRRSDGIWRSFVTVVPPSVELYLRGLAEMPSSWDSAALQSQAIVGRAYALHRRNVIGLRSSCRCHVYDSTYDQAYVGYSKESEGTNASYGKRWVAAVDATRGKVLRDSTGRLAEGLYSSSHGGASESSRFVWGSTVDYLRAVDDSRWEMASGNPGRTWSVGVSAASLGAAFGVGTATSVRLPAPRGLAGRVGRPDFGYGGVVVTGSAGAKTVSGATFRTTINAMFGREVVKSTLFTVASATETAATRDGCQDTTTYAFNASSSRVAGDTAPRMTAAAARSGWASARAAVVTGTSAGPEQVVAAAVAARRRAPLLMTGASSLATPTRRQLERLSPDTVYVVGGTGAVGADVVADIDALPGVTVKRIAGVSPYATARRAALRFGPSASGDAIVTIGAHPRNARVWRFGASAATLAAARLPLLLTRRDGVPAATRRTLQELGATRVLLVGGTKTVAPDVEAQLRSLGFAVARVGSDGSYRTAAAAAAYVLNRQPKPARVLLAGPERSAEAMSAAPLAARLRGTSMLSARCSLADAVPVRDLLRARRATVDAVTVVGTKPRIADRVRAQAADAISG